MAKMDKSKTCMKCMNLDKAAGECPKDFDVQKNEATGLSECINWSPTVDKK